MRSRRTPVPSQTPARVCAWTDETVRYHALCMFDSDAMDMHASDVLARACSAVTNMLNDPGYEVRDAETRARIQWAAARAFVQDLYIFRPYAIVYQPHSRNSIVPLWSAQLTQVERMTLATLATPLSTRSTGEPCGTLA